MDLRRSGTRGAIAQRIMVPVERLRGAPGCSAEKPQLYPERPAQSSPVQSSGWKHFRVLTDLHLDRRSDPQWIRLKIYIFIFISLQIATRYPGVVKQFPAAWRQNKGAEFSESRKSLAPNMPPENEERKGGK